MSNTIECKDCGAQFETKRRNTKYCEVCRAIRNLLYVGSHRKECVSCESTFAPLARDDILCGECDFIDSGKRVRGKCTVCSTAEAILMHKDIRVCLACGRNPEKRTLLLKALFKKKRAQSNG